MKTLIITLSVILSSLVVFSQASLKISTGVVKIKDNTEIKISDDLLIESNGAIKNDGSINLLGDFYNDGNSFTNDFLTPTPGEIKFSGSQQQNISGNSKTLFENVKLDNSFGLKVNQKTLISDVLTFTSGKIFTETISPILFTDSASYIGANNDRFINGSASKSGILNFTFPIGKGNFIRPIGTRKTSGYDIYTAEYFDYDYGDNTTNGLSKASVYEFWTLENQNSTQTRVYLTWNEGSLVADGYELDLVVAKYDGENWTNRGGVYHSGNYLSGSVISSNQSSSGIFTLGSLSKNNPLPVELIEFSANCQNNGLLLNWSTASETNNAFFTIEKSSDLENWIEVSKITGAGNSVFQNNYSYLIENCADEFKYFRLSQTDFDGTVKTFDIISRQCSCNENKFELKFESNKILNFNTNSDEEIIYEVFDCTGKLIFSDRFLPSNGKNLINIAEFTSKTMIIVRATQGNIVETQKLITL